MTQMFVVLTDEKSMAMDIAIMSAYPGRYFRYSSDVWLVLEKDNMAAPHVVSSAIGFNSKHGINGVVISVATFYGVASPELTEWLRLHGYGEAPQPSKHNAPWIEATKTDDEEPPIHLELK